MRLFFGFMVFLLFFYGCTTPKADSVGEPDAELKQPLKKAPDFELQDLEGNLVTLSDFRGKKVILNFWASWCPPCKEEIPLFEKTHLQNPDVVFMGVNLQENPTIVRNFLDQMNVTYLNLLDPESKAKKSYNLITQPETFFINENGYLVEKKVGFFLEEEFLEKFTEFVGQKTTGSGSSEKNQASNSQTEQLITKSKDYEINPDDISIVLGKDGIQSIDNPNFESASASNNWLSDNEVGVGISRNKETKFYPFIILSRHEIVNDFFGGEPVLVSYCPLCRTAIAFNREINGEAIEFGVSGKLYNSEVVMYDRKTESYWLQTPGQAVTGSLKGKKLKRLPSDVSTYGSWKSIHPDTLVLSRKTGFSYTYSSDPYSGYYSSENIWYPTQAQNKVLSNKELVLGIELNGQAKAYAINKIREEKLISDELGGIQILVVYDSTIDSGRIFSRVVDEKTLNFTYGNGQISDSEGNTLDIQGKIVEGPDKGKELENLAAIDHFWFSWYAFYPETEIYN